jgi:hypothetical protein
MTTERNKPTTTEHIPKRDHECFSWSFVCPLLAQCCHVAASHWSCVVQGYGTLTSYNRCLVLRHRLSGSTLLRTGLHVVRREASQVNKQLAAIQLPRVAVNIPEIRGKATCLTSCQARQVNRRQFYVRGKLPTPTIHMSRVNSHSQYCATSRTVRVICFGCSSTV